MDRGRNRLNGHGWGLASPRFVRNFDQKIARFTLEKYDVVRYDFDQIRRVIGFQDMLLISAIFVDLFFGNEN